MGRLCTICTHPNVEDINRHLIHGTSTMTYIAEMYDVSVYALKRHKSNHLQDIIDQAAAEVAEQAKKDAISTIETLETVLIEKFPSLLEGSPSYSQYLDWLKFRSQLRGEVAGPAKVEIEWGPTVQEDGTVVEEPEGLSDEQVEELEQFIKNQ